MKIQIPILSVMATTVIVTTACSAPPVIHDSGPSPAAFSTLPSPSATAAADAIRIAKEFGAERIDVAAARAALDAGRPFLVALPDGAVPACHTALLVPGDPKAWILNTTGAASSTGHTLDRELLQYGCDSGVEIPTPRVPVPAPILPLDQAAKAAAVKAAVPFIYGMPDGGAAACNTAVVLPSGDAWFLNHRGAATVRGTTLERVQYTYGCTGMELPGNGVVLPGQTPAPTTSGGVR